MSFFVSNKFTSLPISCLVDLSSNLQRNKFDAEDDDKCTPMIDKSVDASTWPTNLHRTNFPEPEGFTFHTQILN